MPAPILQHWFLLPENPEIIVAFAFDMMTDIALLAFLISSCLIRRPRHHPKAIPFKSLFVCLLSNIIYITIILSDLLQVLFPHIYLPGNRLATGIVADICWYLQFILTANVLYQLIRAYNAANSPRRNRATKSVLVLNMQGGILVILFIVSVVSIIIPEVKRDIETDLQNFYIAGHVLFLTASLEIMFEIFMIVWKQKDLRLSCKNGAISLMAGGVFFVALSLSWLIADFKMDSMDDLVEIGLFPEFLHIAIAICAIGLYTGIIHCCMQWHKLGPHRSSKPSSTEDERAHMLGSSNEGLH